MCWTHRVYNFDHRTENDIFGLTKEQVIFTSRPLLSSASERRISQVPELWESYELNTGVRFCHRTAYDFLFENSKGREYLEINCPSLRNRYVLNALVQLSKCWLLDAEFFAHFGYIEWVKIKKE